MSNLTMATDDRSIGLLVEAIEQVTGLQNPTLTELHTHALATGRKVSEVLAEAGRIAADLDLGRRRVDGEIRRLRTVQDIGQYAAEKGLDAGAVFSRRMRMQQESAN